MSPRLLAILLCLTLTGCATTRQPRAPESPRAVENTPRAPHPLAASLDALLHTTDAKNALWGVFVQSLDSGDTIYDYQRPESAVRGRRFWSSVLSSVSAYKL
ncbi:MAG: hypothetical protein O3A25_15010 [Acidobacteria bacterium]|nr:hypothetical protein [Acidobacteriota bacterium]